METHRALTSKKNKTATKAACYEKLYYGLHKHVPIKNMQRVTVPQSVILPISTRSVGFMIRFLISKFARQNMNVKFHALCSALYRVTLLQIDIKLSQAMRKQYIINTGREWFLRVDIPDFANSVCLLGTNFGPLVNLVSSIGVIKAFGTQYIPGSVKNTVDKHVRSFDPTTVTYSNLREYVTALSSTSTPYAVRKYFYDHSPLPNAHWSVQARVPDDDIDESKPILLNADEIMPANYDLTALLEDINIIKNSVEIISRKYGMSILGGRIDYSANGSNTMLVSNDVGDIRCSDLSWVGTDPAYDSKPLSGTIENFWSQEVLSDSEFYLGVCHLLGERVKSTARSEAFDVRSRASAKQTSSLNYYSGLHFISSPW